MWAPADNRPFRAPYPYKEPRWRAQASGGISVHANHRTFSRLWFPPTTPRSKGPYTRQTEHTALPVRSQAKPHAHPPPIIIMVNSDDEGDDSDDGVLGTLSTNRGVAPDGWGLCARALDRQQGTTQAPRARSSPAKHTQGPPIPQRCFVRRLFSTRDGTARKHKPSATHLPWPDQGRGRGNWSSPQNACRRCGKPISEHILDTAMLTAVKAFVDHGRADSLLRMWWAQSHHEALDRPKVAQKTRPYCMTRFTTWQHMAHLTKRPYLNLGMGTLLPLSSRTGELARRVRRRSQTTFGPSGLTHS